MGVIRDFCTIAPPGQTPCRMDVALRTKLVNVIHGSDCDGAADEQRCSKDLQSLGHLPNMRRFGLNNKPLVAGTVGHTVGY